ncbi:MULTISPECIES: amidohydrolase [Kitasatospora]|uniref:Putative peptidase M38 family protein n=1 Tax=Kitasatospora setae (strain ATCC 33774 / DSM 43861 / JCM 3304 / KCC A-0304 / NBRC 14216 / KM-6054) TaxID=452652 RepID=E4NG19_KITSK|nr:amidohydrolase [Kitasatospora setae]BAJ30449.1 putative peptidase M38 family protein [Kitasatospora setae KM-6054]
MAAALLGGAALALVPGVAAAGEAGGRPVSAGRPRGVADRVWHNGNVVTLDGRDRVVSAVAVKDGRILAVGGDREVLRYADRGTELVDLRGRTVLPGFFDAHSHLPAPGLIDLYWADLSSPPVGGVTDLASLAAALRAKAAGTAPGGWVFGWGYDQTLLRERRHPTAADLDRADADRPIWAQHTNGHMGVANSAALARAGITRDTPDPAGGVIVRDAAGNPTGLLQETAQGLLTRVQPAWSAQQLSAGAARTSELYAAGGVTSTVVAGGDAATYGALRAWQRAGLVRQRALLMLGGDPLAPGGLPLAEGEGDEWVKVSGYGEVVYDGSIQGWTGYLREPYHTVPEGLPTDYRGYTNYGRDVLLRRVAAVYAEGRTARLHANGDAAIDDLLDAYEAAIAAHGPRDHRLRVEHAQTATEDQLRRMRRLGVTASFFVSHTYYWGDQHRDIFLGPERARRISPLRSAHRRGVRYSLHLDTPVVPQRPLDAVWSAVNRLTRSGQVLGPEQRATRLEALRGVTSEAAWQHFEEDVKGTLEPGKYADLVVLGADPLRVPAEEIKDVPVLETVVGGASWTPGG